MYNFLVPFAIPGACTTSDYIEYLQVKIKHLRFKTLFQNYNYDFSGNSGLIQLRNLLKAKQIKKVSIEVVLGAICMSVRMSQLISYSFDQKMVNFFILKNTNFACTDIGVELGGEKGEIPLAELLRGGSFPPHEDLAILTI